MAGERAVQVAALTLGDGTRIYVFVEPERVVLSIADRAPLRLAPLEAVELAEALDRAGSRRWFS